MKLGRYDIGSMIHTFKILNFGNYIIIHDTLMISFHEISMHFHSELQPKAGFEVVNNVQTVLRFHI